MRRPPDNSVKKPIFRFAAILLIWDARVAAPLLTSVSAYRSHPLPLAFDSSANVKYATTARKAVLDKFPDPPVRDVWNFKDTENNLRDC